MGVGKKDTTKYRKSSAGGVGWGDDDRLQSAVRCSTGLGFMRGHHRT